MPRRSRILVYEFATGGGLANEPEPARSPWFTEGHAMVCALAEDLRAIPGCDVRVVCDARLKLDLPRCQLLPVEGDGGDLEALASEAARVDRTVLIAPEVDGILESRARAVAAAGGKLLGPGAELIALCGNKQRLIEHLAASGVPVPDGCLIRSEGARPAESWFPAVLKPLDGAGSAGVRFVANAASLPAPAERTGVWRLERYLAGTAASIACLQGPRGSHLLEPCRQRIVRNGDGLRYAGGHLPLSNSHRARAQHLAARAIAVLPAWQGYLGLDMVLGPAADGSQDIVIEANPRLTTSYTGLRLAAEVNLAEAMLAIAEGEHREIGFTSEPIYFSAAGLAWCPSDGGRRPKAAP